MYDSARRSAAYSMYARMFFVAFLFLPVVLGEILHRNVRFDMKPTYDDFVCKSGDCVFIRSAKSHVACSIPCLANQLCVGFFYNNVTKKCYGSRDVSQVEPIDHLARLNGTTYYEKQLDVNETITADSTSNDPTTSSTPVPTPTSIQMSTPTPTSTDRTTALMIPSVADGSDNPKMTSDPGPSQIPPGPVVPITIWENSSYHLVMGINMETSQGKCIREDPESHLAWIDSSEENDHLAKFLANSQTDAAYIGYTSDFRNTGEKNLVYQPRKELATYIEPWAGHENLYVKCIQLNTRGYWVSVDCYRDTLAICERDMTNPTSDQF